MPPLNKLTATGIPNVRQRILADGDTAIYIKVQQSYVLAGLQSAGMTPVKALLLMVGASNNVEPVSVPVPVRTIITLNDVFAKFEGFVNAMTDPTKNDTDYIARYNNHIRSRFGERSLTDITATEVGSLHATLEASMSESTAYQVCHTIRYLYNRAIEWGMYSGRVPMGRGTAFVLPMPQRKREETYTADEVNAILDELQARSPQTYDMVLLAYLSGLRLSEIFGLQTCHVNKLTGRVKIVDPKGKRDSYIQLSPMALEFIGVRMTGAASDYIFKARNGGKINDLSKTFARVVKKLGINDGVEDSRFKKTFHNFRHTFATRILASRQVSIGDLKNILGHKSVKTTERYIHPSEEALVKAGGIMEGSLGRG